MKDLAAVLKHDRKVAIGIGISMWVGRVHRPIADRARTDERVAA